MLPLNAKAKLCARKKITTDLSHPTPAKTIDQECERSLVYPNYGRFLVSGLNERHRTGSDRTEQRTGTNGTAFPFDRLMTVWYSLENKRSYVGKPLVFQTNGTNEQQRSLSGPNRLMTVQTDQWPLKAFKYCSNRSMTVCYDFRADFNFN